MIDFVERHKSRSYFQRSASAEECRRMGETIMDNLKNLDIDIKHYGATMPLSQLASIEFSESTECILVNPWDKTTVENISSTIINSGIVCDDDGGIITIPVLENRFRLEQSVQELLKMLSEEK
jgi:ribosome recycling factor